MHLTKQSRSLFAYRFISVFLLISFSFTTICPPSLAQVLPQPILNLPMPGTFFKISPSYTPVLMKGLIIHPENPLQFDFIINEGDTKSSADELKAEAAKLIKYFLAALTVPEKDLWVNLSPYEKDRLVAPGLSSTEMGRDLLAQDYLLKQLSASLVYPENELGKKFWDRVYKKAFEKFGTTEITLNTFNKVWIIPDKAVVYEQGPSAFVVEKHLKVMLEEDYVALDKSLEGSTLQAKQGAATANNSASQLSSEIIREIIIPEIEKEVNEGKTFANLRQIYNSMILAVWYKKNLRETLLGRVYVDQGKIKGIDSPDKSINQKIYDQYLAAFQKGVYNYIKEEYDLSQKQVVPRKYFSGGAGFEHVAERIQTLRDGAMLTAAAKAEVKRTGDVRVEGLFFENTDAAMLASAAGEGPVARWKGIPLTKEQHEIYTKAIEEFENDAAQKDLLRKLKREELLHLDRKSKLYGYELVVIRGLKNRVSQLVAEVNVSRAPDAQIEDPRDVLTHPRRYKEKSYMDEDDLTVMMNWPEGWRDAWAEHEAAHFQHKDWTEEKVQKEFPLPWRMTQSSLGGPVAATAGTDLAVVKTSETTVLPAPIGEHGLSLPPHMNEILSMAVKGGPEQLLSTVMRDESTVQGLLATKAWHDEDALRDTLDEISFGNPTDDTVKAARKFAAIVSTATGTKKVSYLVADTLMRKRIKAGEFMEIADEILRRSDRDLAENLEGLLRDSPEIQRKAFQWLFDRMLRAAKDLTEGLGDREESLLISRIILQQFNRVISKVEEKKWLALRIHILMQFAKQLSTESQQAPKEKKFLMASLIALYPDVSKDFFLAVNTNFTSVTKVYDSEDPGLESMLREYGGYESYAQSVETLLAFANLAWPEWFFGYLQEHFVSAPNIVKAYYLASMRFGMYERDPQTNKPVRILPERLEFIIANAVALTRHTSTLIRNKLREILWELPEPYIEYLSRKDRYTLFSQAQRSFMMEILLGLATTDKIKGGRQTILNFVMFELKEEENLEIQKQLLLSQYFTDEILEKLDLQQAKQLRETIINGYYEFKKNDVVDKNILRIMVKYRTTSIFEAFEFFARMENVDYDKALGVLFLAGHVAAAYKTNEPNDRVELARLIELVKALTKKATDDKVKAVKEFYDLREKITKIYKEVIGLERQVEVAETSLKAVNLSVADLKKQQEELRGAQVKLQKEIGRLTTEVGTAKTMWKGAARFSPERDAAKKKYKALVGQLTEDKIVYEANKDRLAKIKPDIEKAEREQAAMVTEVNAFYKDYKRKMDWLQKAEGKELHPEYVTQEEEDEAELGEMPFVYLKEVAKRVKEKGQEKAKEEAAKPKEPSFLEIVTEKVQATSRKAADLQDALKLFVSSPSLEADTGKNILDAFKLADGEALTTLVTLVTNAELAGHFSREEIVKLFVEHFRYQVEHGLFRAEVKKELEFLTDRLQEGVLFPTEKDDPILKAIVDGIREKRYAPDQAAAMADLAIKQAELKAKTERIIKDDVIEDAMRIMSSAESYVPMMRDFLRYKFGETLDISHDKLKNWTAVFEYVLGKYGPGIAVEFMYFMLYATFVEPSPDKIEKPKNAAELLELRYRIYYKVYTEFRDKAYKNKVEEMRIEEGFGWEHDASNVAVYYLATLFNSDKTSADVKAEAEKALYLFIFLPWVNEREEAGKQAAEKKAANLSVDAHAVLANLTAYLNQAPVINAANMKDVVEHHTARYVVDLAYGLAKRVIEQPDQVIDREQSQYLSILEKLATVIAPDVIIPKGTSQVEVLLAIKEAIAKLKKEILPAESAADRLLTSPVEERKMHFRLPDGGSLRPQLPGPEEKKPGDGEDSAMLGKKGEVVPGTKFRLGSLNDAEAIKSLRRWSEYKKRVKQMQPGELSGTGFLAQDQDLVDVLLRDYETLQALGVTHLQMAQWVKTVFLKGKIVVNGQTVKLYPIAATMGFQESPLPGVPNSSNIYRIENKKLGLKSSGILTEMHPKLLELWGFFEGDTRERDEDIRGGRAKKDDKRFRKLYEEVMGKHPTYRLDPVELYAIFFGKPVEEVKKLVESNKAWLKVQEPKSPQDKAMLSETKSVKPPGGIDLNPKYLDLQIRRDANGIPLPLPQQPVGTMHIEGLFPIIIQMTPVNLPLLLGWADEPNYPNNIGQKNPRTNSRETRNLSPLRKPDEISFVN